MVMMVKMVLYFLCSGSNMNASWFFSFDLIIAKAALGDANDA